MKILILTDRLDVGGAETHIAELARGLRKAGAEVECLSSGGQTADLLAREGFRQHRLPLCTHNPIRLFFLRRQIKKLIRHRGYEVLHAHARIPALLLRRLKKTGCIRVVTLHARFQSNPLLSRICYWGERTIAVSEDLRAYLCDTYGVFGETVEVIPNGIDCDRFFPCAEKRSEHWIKILFASRLDSDCSLGAEFLCRIAPSLCRAYPKLRIGIAGGGSELSRIGALAESVNRALERTCITVYGQVDDMTSLLQEHDIFVGVSRAAMEAAACGCAVVLCGNEGYLGILDEKSLPQAALSNFCCRGDFSADPARLDCDLRFLIDRPSLCRSLGVKAREWIYDGYNTQSMCEKTLALYHRLLHPPYRRRLLVGGYFGCGNAGDDAILQGFLEGMHKTAPDIQIQALSASPKHAERRFGIRCISRKNPFAIRYALKGADMFVCGGGSLLQNTTSRRSLHYYLSLLRMAKRTDCITVLYAAGIGPIYGVSTPKKLARVLSSCDYISLRDPESLRYLTNLGIERSLLHEGADPALLLPIPPISRTAALLHEAHCSRAKRRLCIILRKMPSNASHLLRSVLIATRILCRRLDLQPIFLVFCREDALTVQSICEMTNVPLCHTRSVGDLAALLRGSHGILSMRLHALILAAASATPAIGLSTDPDDLKIASFARLSGQQVLPYSQPSVAELVALMEARLTDPRAKESILIEEAVTELRKKAWKDLANIVEMLYNKGDDALHQTSTRENDQS